MRCAKAAKNSSVSVACVEIAFSATTRSQIDGPTASRTSSGAASAISAIATAM